MSEKNIEVVQALVESWNAGQMDTAREMYDPDAVLTMAEGWPEPGPFVGRDAVLRQFQEMYDTLEGDLVPVTDFVTVGDRVLVRLAWRGTGRGPELNMEGTTLYTMRDGRVCRVEFFWEHSDGLEAVGHRE